MRRRRPKLKTFPLSLPKFEIPRQPSTRLLSLRSYSGAWYELDISGVYFRPLGSQYLRQMYVVIPSAALLLRETSQAQKISFLLRCIGSIILIL